MRITNVKIWKSGAGIALVVIGALGIFLPLVPGILLILAGLFLLEIKTENLMKWIRKFI